MGFFDSGGPTTLSVLSPEQEQLMRRLMTTLLGGLEGTSEGIGRINSILSGNDPFTAELSGNLYRKALLEPGMRAFEDVTRPAIASGFANIGGTLSSRRGQAIADAATNVQRDAQAQVAGLLPQLIGLQVGGIEAAERLRYLPIQSALQFALSPTRSVAQEPEGQGWGILSDLIGAGATLGTAGLLSGEGGSGGSRKAINTGLNSLFGG